jgi:rSAM/selenodomain-associated transferase 1
MSNALVIFAKAPLAGQVKTRLCPPLSPEEAAELARCFLVDIVERACRLPSVRVYLAITPAGSEPLFRALLPFPVAYLAQRGASLGEREHNIFVDLLQHGTTRMVLIGSDIPTLPLSHLQEAFQCLEDACCDAVFGPSRDGGYYLVGMRALHPELFANITWSTSSVMAETLAQAQKHGLNVALVPSWHDVDDNADLSRLVAELSQPDGNTHAPRTSAFLTQLGLCSGEKQKV